MEERPRVREERLEGMRERERDGVRAEGKDQWEAAAVSRLVVGMKISYGIQDLKGTPAPPDRIVQC